jgi:hypothetical protein
MEKGDKVSLFFFESHQDFIFLGAGQSVFAFTMSGDDKNVWLVVPEHRFESGEIVDDVSKDVLCDAYKSGQGNSYLPEIYYVGSDIVFGHPELNGVYSKIYKMKYYRDMVREDKDQWMMMKQLHKVRSDGKNSVYEIQKALGGPEPSLTFLGNKAARISLSMSGKLNKSLVEALGHLYDGMVSKNRDGLTFEFNLRNVGIDGDGHLVLRDPVYDSSITVKLRKERDDEKITKF